MCIVAGMLGAAGSYACGSSSPSSGPPDQQGVDSSTPADSTAGDDSSMGTDSSGPGTDAADETSTGGDSAHEGQASSGDSGQGDVFVPDGFLETFDATTDTSIVTERDTGSMFPMPDGPTLPLE